MGLFKRIWLNKTYIAKGAGRWTVNLYAIFGVFGLNRPFEDFLSKTAYCFGDINQKCLGVLLCYIIILVIYLIWLLCKGSKVKVLDVSNGYHVYAQYGDIFSPNEVQRPNERRNVVIPVNRCFDTIVDDDLVSSNTLHGIAMKKLYQQGIYDQETLNKAILKSLSEQQIQSESVNRDNKRKGNLERFPVGTVAEVKCDDKCTYFFLALSTFDADLHAHTSSDEHVLALMKMLEFCNKRSQKYPVVMPLIGAGASETKKTERDILEYLLGLIKMNKELINSDVHIVVRNSGKESIPILGL